MKRVLVCTVGGSPQPIVNAIEQTRPDFVYFICSGGEGDAASARTITERTSFKVNGHCPRCDQKFVREQVNDPIAERAGLEPGDYLVEALSDPDDLSAVVAACARVDEELARRFAGHDLQVAANYTGGTKTMSLGLGLYTVRTAGRWELQLNVAPARPDLIKVTAGDVAVPQDTARLLAEDALRRAEELAGRHDYDGAVEAVHLALTSRLLPPDARQGLFSRSAEWKLLAARDRVDYQQALDLALADPALKKRHAPELKKLLRAVTLFCGDEPWGPRDVPGTVLVRDLVDNAARCAVRGRYDDAVGRLYRASELLAQVRLLQAYGVRTGDVDHAGEGFDEPTRTWLESRRDAGSDKIMLGLMASYELLSRLGDPLGCYFASQRDDLLKVINLRNHSLFAHGLTPVGAEQWRRCGPPWQRWIEGALEAVAAG